MFRFFSQIKASFPNISLNWFNLIIALWLAIILNICFYKQVYILSNIQGWFGFVWIAFVAIALTAYFNLYLQLLSWKWTAKPLAILLIVLGGVTAYFTNELGAYISPDQIQNIMQTDRAETTQLLNLPLLFWIFSMVFLPAVCVYILPIQYDSFKKTIYKKLFNILAALCILVVLVLSNFLNFTNIFRQHKDIRQLISPDNVITSSYKYFHHLHKKDEPLVSYGQDATLTQASDLSKPKLLVIVVGEAARAESFSLNSYTRNTNPELSKIPNLINFRQVSSCGTSTAVSVPCMFSGMPRKQYDENLASHRENLIDIAKRAGYKVTWIDNDSGCKGVCNRVNNVALSRSLHKKYCSNDGFCLDDVLLISAQKYLAALPAHDQTPQVLVLHERGSHGPAYYNRTTPEFSPFQPICNTSAIQTCDRNKLINSYDNTIVYTDHILSKIIQTVDQNERYTSALWYLSDHGESTGENGIYLHGTVYALAPSQQTHVAMMLWFSNAWKAKYQAQFDCLNRLKNQPLSQDNLFPTVLSLLDIKTNVLDQNLNILSQCSS